MMEAVTKIFEKMAIGEYSEELAASPMEVDEEEGDCLRLQFDSLEESDENASDWIPMKHNETKSPEPSCLDTMRSSKVDNILPSNTADHSWPQFTSSWGPAPSAFLPEVKEEALETPVVQETYESLNDTPFVDTDCPFDAHLKACTSVTFESLLVNYESLLEQKMSKIETAKRKIAGLKTSFGLFESRLDRYKKDLANKSLLINMSPRSECKVSPDTRKGETAVTLSQTPFPTSRSQQTTRTTEPLDHTPFPLSSTCWGSFCCDRPSSFVHEDHNGQQQSVVETRGWGSEYGNHKQLEHNHEPNLESPGSGLWDLQPVVKQLVEKELKRPDVMEVGEQPNRASSKEDISIQPANSKAVPNYPAKSNGLFRPKNRNGRDIAAAQQSVSPSVTAATKPSMKEICIVLDNSNTAVEKFLVQLRSNLESLWDFVCSSSDETVRMSIATPRKKIDFTSSKPEFVSFCDDACGKDRVSRDGSSLTAGLEGALQRMDELNWTRGSMRSVYIFTNLSEWDNDNDRLRWELRNSLCRVTQHLPRKAAVLVGCWRRDNALLEDALNSRSRPFEKFAFLNLKQMASFVVDDKNILAALVNSNTAEKKKGRVEISIDSTLQLNRKRCTEGPSQSTVSEAMILQMKPLETINDVLSQVRPNLCNRACWMTRKPRVHHENYDEVYSFGSLGWARGVWKEEVMLKSLKLDVLNGVKGVSSLGHHKNRAFAGAMATFFAKQYNKEHRPLNCAKIQFLQGYVIEQAPEEGRHQVFFAEHLVGGARTDVPKFTKYCNAAGRWDETVVSESLLRFALTCFKLSGGDIMLSGLKGIQRDDVYTLTVPTVLSRTDGDVHTKECTKEYMKLFRKNTKTIMEERGWNNQKPSRGIPGEMKSKNHGRKSYFTALCS